MDELPHPIDVIFWCTLCTMRMDTDGACQLHIVRSVLLCKLDGLLAALDGRAREQDMAHMRFFRTMQYIRQPIRKAIVGQVGANVNDRSRRSFVMDRLALLLLLLLLM